VEYLLNSNDVLLRDLLADLLQDTSTNEADGAGGTLVTPCLRKPRKKRTIWTTEETVAVMEGYEKYGSSWADIKQDPTFGDSLLYRDPVQIKDKHRTEERKKMKRGDPTS
jgi:hypothetical protein